MAGKKKAANSGKTEDGVEPLTISVSLGVTVEVGERQYLKPQVEVRNIRLDKDVEAQVNKAIEGARIAWLAIDREMEVQIVEMTSGAAGQESVRDTLEKMEAWINGVAKKNFTNIAKEVKKHKAQLDLIKEGHTGD